MKLFTIGLIAGTAFAEPNLRPTDRKLSGDGTITVVDDTLTLNDGTVYDDLDTIAGVKALAVAFKTQEQAKLTQCKSDLITYDSNKIAYDSALKAYKWATAKKAYEEYLAAKNKYDLCQEWSAYGRCTSQPTADALVGQRAETELDSQTPSRRRLDITVGHLDAALNYLGSGMTTCTQPDENEPSNCPESPASAPSIVNDPGDWTGSGADPDYSGTLTEPNAPTAPTGCGTICATAPTDPQNSCSIRNPCIVEKVCGIKRVILALDPNHVFS